jgi:hypothetical protein
MRHHRFGVAVLAVTATGIRLIETAELRPGERITMNPITLSVGHVAALSIIYLDQNGNPMLTTPTPDAPPTWSNTNSAAATLAAASDGLTATETAIAAGSDTVNLSLAVSGQSFSASLGVTVQAAAQVLTSIQIGSTIS